MSCLDNLGKYASHADWEIHRKLDEARTVYIYPARGSGRTKPLYELVDDLMKSGKKVRFARSADLPKKTIDVEQLKRTTRDLDLWVESKWNKLIDDYIYEQFQQQLFKSFVMPIPDDLYKIKCMPDSYIYSLKNYEAWSLRELYFPEVFKVVEEVNEPNPLWTKEK